MRRGRKERGRAARAHGIGAGWALGFSARKGNHDTTDDHTIPIVVHSFPPSHDSRGRKRGGASGMRHIKALIRVDT